MKIVIVGDGKVGATLAEQLSLEGHDITIIDNNADRRHSSSDILDIMSVTGNGATFSTQIEAGVDKADLLIAATSSDEVNMMCCLVAKKAGAKHTIARVRNPEYAEELNLFRDDLGLSMTVNPELACATEMARLVRVPSAMRVDTFARGRVELLKIQLSGNSPLVNHTLQELSARRYNVLIAAVERGEQDIYIPDGSFRLEAGDRLSIAAKPADAAKFFKRIGIAAEPIRNVMIVGGGRIAYYLSKQLLDLRMNVKIIDSNLERCRQLAELLPQATIVHGDGTDEQILEEEGLAQMDAFLSMTGIDEENILLSLFAKRNSHAKVVTKINRTAFLSILDGGDLGSIFSPRYVAAESILRYVRGMQNSYGSKVETLYQIVGGKAEALEFRVCESSPLCGKQLMDLNLKKGLLICCINHRGNIIIPSGQDRIAPNDTVIVVTTTPGLGELEDILERKRG
ncbi:MAG: Trk system potassium transporter TrkA [Clostridiales bacterium]|nr:Trk system potassium transporter TrkA [Clostridiales bacterium]